jgi:hypothetical protein
MGRLLSPPLKRFLKNPKNYPNANKSQNYGRIREYSLGALEDLGLAAKLLPDGQVGEIFTVANRDLRDLIGGLIGKDEPQRSERHYQLARLLAIESLNVLDDKIPGHDGHTRADILVYEDEREKFRAAKALIMATVERGYELPKK